MSSPNHAQLERSALCDLLAEVGPDAPTLCEGWTTRDLAAHLVVRERRPDAALGILFPPAASYGESVRRKVAGRPYDELIELVRSGPPLLSPTRLGPVDRLANTLEMYVHHEDVRRAVTGWEPRTLDPTLVGELGGLLRRAAKLMVRRSPVGITLVPGGGEPIAAKVADPTVELAGPVGELILYVEGRQDHARVEASGDADAIERARTASFGI